MQYEIIVKSWLWTVYTECMEYWDMIRRFNSVIQNQNVALNTRHQKTTVDFIWLWYFKSACTGSKIISEINSVSNSYVYFLRKLLSIVINMVFIKYNIYFKAIKYSMITLVLSFFKCLVEINFFALFSLNKNMSQTIELTINSSDFWKPCTVCITSHKCQQTAHSPNKSRQSQWKQTSTWL